MSLSRSWSRPSHCSRVSRDKRKRRATADLQYYVQRVWGPLFYRRLVSDRVFARIPTIYLPDRPALPADRGTTAAASIDQFMIRLKHSLRDTRDTVAFWMVQELAGKKWDPAAVDIPGLTAGLPAGLPAGVRGYPTVTAK